MVVIINKKRFAMSLICIILILISSIFLISKSIKKSLYPMEYSEIVKPLSEKYSLDEYLIYAIIKTESNFKADAHSHKSAKGLMQVTGDTAAWCVEKFSLDVSAENLYDAKTNITIGCAYFEYLLEHFGGDVSSALAAYNAGQGNVTKWLSDKKYSSDGKNLEKIPFEETREYVKKVLKRRDIYIEMYEK